jgi:hypothetical protein
MSSTRHPAVEKTEDSRFGKVVRGKYTPCSLELLISHGTAFFSHNKTALADLSAAETISRTGRIT